MDWFKTNAIYPGVFQISEPFSWVDNRFNLNTVNCYLVIGNESAVLIDTGMGVGNLLYHIKKLTSLPIQVLNTHYHWDHIGGNHQFNKCSIHHLETKLLNTPPKLDYPFLRDKLKKLKQQNKLPLSSDPEKYQVNPSQADALLSDEMVIPLGGRNIHTIHTPGHSPGSLCFLDDKSGCLFSGDTAYMGPIYICFTYADPEAYFQSVIRLKNLKTPKLICPGHNQVISEPSWLKELSEVARLALTGKMQGERNDGFIQSIVYSGSNFSLNFPL